MRAPKGFGKNYFTLTAIQACSSAVSLQKRSVRTEAYRLNIGDESEEETDEKEDAAAPLCASALSLPVHSGRLTVNCNGHFRRNARRHLLYNPKQNLNIPTYIRTNSGLSPPQTQLPTQKHSKRHSMNYTFLPSLAAIFAASAINAKTVTLTPLEVTSSPLHNSELTAPDAVEIYTAFDIEKAHVQTLYDFFNQETSLTAMPAYGNPLAQKLDLHGYGIGNGYQNIVVILNGRRLNNVDMVPQLLSSIPPSDIERIEIIKSSGIVLGGDGANAGVINITTKNNGGKSVTLYGGLYDTYSGAFHAGHSDELVTLSASGEAYRTAGTRHIDADQNRDTQKLASGAVDLVVTPVEALSLRLGVRSTRTDAHYGGPMTQAEYDDNPAQPGSGYGFGPSPSQQKYDSDAFNAGTSYELNAHWSFDLDAFIENKKSDFVTYDNVYYYDYQSLRAAVNYARDDFKLTFGGDYFDGRRQNGGNAYTLENETAKRNAAGFALAQYRLQNHTFKAGYRFEQVAYAYDDSNTSLDKDDTLNGAELGYNLQLDRERSLFFNYAHAYQAPDIDRFFAADYGSYPPTVQFNGFIEPMESDSFTLGYTAVTPANKLKFSVYYVALRNEIFYYADPGFIASRNTNIDRSHKYGLDLYDKWVLSRQIALMLNYNFVDAVIDEEVQNGEDFGGNRVPGVSNHSLKAAVALHPAERTTVTFAHTFRSETYAMNDFGNSFAQKQQAYNSTDVALAYTQAAYELFAKINNIFNMANGLWVQDDAVYPVDFTTTAIAGLKMRF